MGSPLVARRDPWAGLCDLRRPGVIVTSCGVWRKENPVDLVVGPLETPAQCRPRIFCHNAVLRPKERVQPARCAAAGHAEPAFANLEGSHYMTPLANHQPLFVQKKKKET